MLPADGCGETPGARCIAQGVRPAGLGARDTLRLEAGMNLTATTWTRRTIPLESGLAWTVAFEPQERDFIGREALARARAAARDALVGLVLEERGVLRSHQRSALRMPRRAAVGEVTSGTFSPTLESLHRTRAPARPQPRARCRSIYAASRTRRASSSRRSCATANH